MSMKPIKAVKPLPPKPSQPLRYFRHKETGAIHPADPTWAPVMANRNDLEEVQGDTNEDDE